eukprot:TRINITY_DN5858_c0_g1_i2.p1 TRINITY_DN5858_c0_g1~~TRINITY_DN5858_c0_g1_i2.p1  ORF type:complete len:173 (+),score=7.71 TRINITY_DN5858_c0_g1_i2:77-595(+)
MSTLVPMAGCLRYFCAMKMCSPIQRRNSTRGSSYSVLTRNSRRGHGGSSKIVYGAKGKIYNSDYNKTPMILRLAVEFITEILRSFSARGNRTLLLLYVDDIKLPGDNPSFLSLFITKGGKEFAMKNLRYLHHLVGVDIHRSEGAYYQIRPSMLGIWDTIPLCRTENPVLHQQ